MLLEALEGTGFGHTESRFLAGAHGAEGGSPAGLTVPGEGVAEDGHLGEITPECAQNELKTGNTGSGRQTGATTGTWGGGQGAGREDGGGALAKEGVTDGRLLFWQVGLPRDTCNFQSENCLGRLRAAHDKWKGTQPEPGQCELRPR